MSSDCARNLAAASMKAKTRGFSTSRGRVCGTSLEPVQNLFPFASTLFSYMTEPDHSHGELADHGGNLVVEQLVK